GLSRAGPTPRSSSARCSSSGSSSSLLAGCSAAGAPNGCSRAPSEEVRSAGGSERGAEDGRRAPLAVPDAARIEVGRRPPALGAERIDLLFLDPQARVEEEAVPAVGLALPEPAVIPFLAARAGAADP